MPPKFPHPRPIRESSSEVRPRRRYCIARAYRCLQRRRYASAVKELLPQIERWREQGEQVAVATVVASRRSAPRPIGSKLVVSERGEVAGSVSGGCVESEVCEAALEVLRTGQPRLLSYGIEDETAFSVGLPCGGEIDVFVEPLA